MVNGELVSAGGFERGPKINDDMEIARLKEIRAIWLDFLSVTTGISLGVLLIVVATWAFDDRALIVVIIVAAVLSALAAMVVIPWGMYSYVRASRVRHGAPPGLYENGLQYDPSVFIPYEEFVGYRMGRKPRGNLMARNVWIRTRAGKKGRAGRYRNLRIWESQYGKEILDMLVVRICGNGPTMDSPPEMNIYPSGHTA
ncbi:MAG: hypothetical protein JSW25_03315 [Thermoplasmata archaeon]|nr:MAG: hypothetical protein JSW25_03315 [Thermoplasmata archaeon]